MPFTYASASFSPLPAVSDPTHDRKYILPWVLWDADGMVYGSTSSSRRSCRWICYAYGLVDDCATG